MNDKKIEPYSPEDMKRRRSRAIAMAFALVAFMVIIFITTFFKMKQGMPQ